MLNTRSTPSGGVQSVQRALSILETLAGAADGMGVTEAARALGLKTPTAHNLLRTLASRGYAAQDASTQKYRLGPACAALGRAFQAGLSAPRAAEPHLQALSQKLNESAVLGVFEQGEVAFVARVEAEHVLTVNFDRVWVRFAYDSVCGRVLLAHMPPEERDAYIRSHPLSRARDKDLRTKKALLEHLEQVRKQGYCAYWREQGTVLAVAAPVFDADGRVAAAVGVPVPSVRVGTQTKRKIIQAVRRTAEQISRDLGYSPPSTSAPRRARSRP